KMLPSNDPQFKGVQGIYYYKDGDNHKYVTNVTRDANEVKTAVKMLKEQFPGAFVIRIKDGKRI
ncbi:MAG: N-acetylmuramoyl-L-alanine amidase, partial [Prevotella sp.]|nr:N-acetylmuramoyl-L-alanine amidase [Prevotella sp.]